LLTTTAAVADSKAAVKLILKSLDGLIKRHAISVISNYFFSGE
jgi:hypothetical protein